MTDCIAIRTYTWGPDEERLVAALTPVFGDRVRVAFHNRKAGVTPSVPVADFNDDWVRDNGLRVLADYGWRCGDYALYALRQAFPEFDHYWLIEPDVVIHGDVAEFFAEAAKLRADGIGVDFAQQAPKENRFVKGLPAKMVPYRATFALTRFSGRALDYLFEARKTYCKTAPGAHRFTNDETFCFSHLMAHRDFTAGGLKDHMPAWFDQGLFDTDPDLLDRSVETRLGSRNQVCHPVRPIDSFIDAVSKRVAGNASGFLKNMTPSFAEMSAEELTQLGTAVQQRITELAQTLKDEHKTETPQEALR